MRSRIALSSIKKAFGLPGIRSQDSSGRCGSVPPGGPPVPLIVAPGPAAHPVTASILACSGILPGGSIARRAPVVVMPVIFDPLPDIAVHVVDTPRVCRVGADLAGGAQPR